MWREKPKNDFNFISINKRTLFDTSGGRLGKLEVEIRKSSQGKWVEVVISTLLGNVPMVYLSIFTSSRCHSQSRHSFVSFGRVEIQKIFFPCWKLRLRYDGKQNFLDFPSITAISSWVGVKLEIFIFHHAAETRHDWRLNTTSWVLENLKTNKNVINKWSVTRLFISIIQIDSIRRRLKYF